MSHKPADEKVQYGDGLILASLVYRRLGVHENSTAMLRVAATIHSEDFPWLGNPYATEEFRRPQEYLDDILEVGAEVIIGTHELPPRLQSQVDEYSQTDAFSKIRDMYGI